MGVVGYNGSGKTTFFHVIMGLLAPSAGKIEVCGRPVIHKDDYCFVRQHIGLLFQDADDQLFCPTVIEDVAFGPLNQGKPPDEAKGIAMEVLDRLGIAALAERVTYRLSGGEKKLVSLATVLAMQPAALLLDEPTTGLDEETKGRITKILKETDLSYVLISHEYDFLAKATDFVYLMLDGKMVLDDGEAIHSHFHTHRYGVYPHHHTP